MTRRMGFTPVNSPEWANPSLTLIKSLDYALISMVNKDQQRLAAHIISRCQKKMGENRVYQKKGTVYLVTGEPGRYYLTMQSEGEERLVLTELILLDEGDRSLSFFWTFLKEKGEWRLDRGYKDDMALGKTLLLQEMIDLRERLDAEDDNRGRFLEPPGQNSALSGAMGPYLKKNYASLYMLIASAVLFFGLFITLFTGNIQYNRMVRIVNQLDRTISESANLNENVLDDLNRQIRKVTADLTAVEAGLAREQQNLEFNRFNMAETVKISVRDIPSRQTSRRTAYFYLAGLIEQASSFGELYYHFTRLPRTETEAELLLATDKDNILELDSYKMVFSHLVYPVRNDGGENDGQGFIISSGFSSKRNSPLGEGGYLPHYAVDIINISNILKITPQGGDLLTRTEEAPGAIVSVDDGRVIFNGESYDYGWSLEIEHNITSEIRAGFPGVTRFTTFYAHLAEQSNAKIGDFVSKNEKIGDIGNTGKSTGPHLHLEVRIYSPSGKQTGYKEESFDGINPLSMK